MSCYLADEPPTVATSEAEWSRWERLQIARQRQRIRRAGALGDSAIRPSPEQLARSPAEWLEQPIVELEAFGLDLRAINALEENGQLYIWQLLEIGIREIGLVPYIGYSTLLQLIQILDRVGITLRQDAVNDALNDLYTPSGQRRSWKPWNVT